MKTTLQCVFRAAIMLLLFCGALTFAGSAATAYAETPTEAKAGTPPTTPSAGKALVCIYRVYRFTGSASHDNLFINSIPLAKLLSSEYACMEVMPGTVVVSGLPKMYFGGVIQSTGALLAESRKKENERIRFEAAADKTYYLKWTAGAMATGIKVTPEDPGVGAKEMSKLHPSKPLDLNEAAKEEAK